MKPAMRILSLGMLLVVTLAMVGCGGNFVQDQARDSLASFLGSVASNAINSTINPD